MSSDPSIDGQPREYDALLIVSFGGPEGPDDVAPFLDNVLRGLPIRPQSRQRIVDRYLSVGGVSPINAQIREFIAALRSELDQHGPALPIYWGNRNWHPLLGDTLKQMENDGIGRAIAFVTSMYSSYSGCRKYREDLYAAAHGLAAPPIIDKLRLGFNHPGFIAAAVDRVTEALQRIDDSNRAATPILFTAHSLPESMARHCRYVAQLRETCELISAALEHPRWDLVYQSNNASYGGEPWLGPDICEAIAERAALGDKNVVVAPIGFVCDHLEVVMDLDKDAADAAAEHGVNMIRAATVGTHDAYVAMVRELIIERMTASKERRALGRLGPSHDVCPVDCCLSGRPGPAKPAACGLEQA